MIPNWPWALNNDKYSAGTKDLPLRLKLWSILLYHKWFSRYKVDPKLEMHQKTPHWTSTPNSQHLIVKYSIYTKYLLQKAKLVRFTLRRAFSKIKFVKNRKCAEWPQTELEHLTVKGILYTLHTSPTGPNFGQFRSMSSRFWDRNSSKNGNSLNDPKINLNT